MEQKLYNYEVMLNLLKGENHLRQIAKDLKMNHMTIKRALDREVAIVDDVDIPLIRLEKLFNFFYALHSLSPPFHA